MDQVQILVEIRLRLRVRIQGFSRVQTHECLDEIFFRDVKAQETIIIVGLLVVLTGAG